MLAGLGLLVIGASAQQPTTVQKGGAVGVNNITADLYFPAARELRVAGILPESAASRALGGALAIMSLDAAQILVGKPNKVDVINIRIEKDATADAVRTRVQRALGEQYTVEAPERRGKRLGRMLLTLTTVMRLISAVAILVGLFIVQNTLATAVHRRRREIAIQRALGITRALSGLMVLLEASLLGLLGGVLGAPLGLALAKGALSLFTESISSLYTAVHPRPPTLSSTLWFLVSAGAVVCSCLAALRPALHAASVPPALVLASRGTSTASEGRTRSGVRALLMSLAALLAAYGVAQLPSPGDEPWWGYVTCLLVLGAGALAAQPALFAVQALSIPVAGRFSFAWRLGAEALTRDAPRAGQTVTALMLGLALFIGVSGWVQTVKTSILNWMDAAVPADLSILEGTSMPDARAVPMEPSLAAGFADDPDVETVFRERFRTLDLGDETTRVQAIDASAYMSRARLPVVSSAGVVDGKALEAGEVLLTENLAARLGVKPGGTIALPGADGMRGMRVRAVVVDYTSEIGVVWMDWGVYARIFEDPKVDAFNLYLRPGADPDVVRSRILARHGASGTLRVVSHESLKAFVVDLIDDAFAATRALELIALLIALMGIINTLFAAVLDRVREIGVLRAVGATRAQVVSMVAVEAVLLGVTAAVMAAVIGSAFGYAFTVVIAEGTTGWRLPFVLPLTTVGEAFLLAILVAAVAAALPARWAARTNIIEAMRVE